MNSIMKVLIYSAKDFEIPFLEQSNKDQFHIKYSKERLTEDTAVLALGFDVVSIFSADDCSSSVLERLRDFGIRYITLRSSGYDNINLKTASRLGIRVANAAGYSPHAIAEHAITLLLSLNRKIIMANQQVHNYNFLLDDLIGFDLNQKTVGIIGTGRIGKVIAKIMNGFGCQIIANDLIEDPDLVENDKVTYYKLEELLQQSDILFLSTPLTSETHHLIRTETIEYMKRNLILINVARGGIVRTEDIIKALELKKIAAYGSDVYEYENRVFFYDRSQNHPNDPLLQELIDLPNSLITPHQAFATKEALHNIAKTTFDNIQSWQNGGIPQNELTPVLKDIDG
ncbi:2-hydroxyacid dehydrogenase [Aquimarina litoralis]|uniref:2-hydroxyacid dehydrogenase n=1 Tax=Aquimarina litoralis TaxID=584605 RepID=A0ABN1J7X0_9FLAO